MVDWAGQHVVMRRDYCLMIVKVLSQGKAHLCACKMPQAEI